MSPVTWTELTTTATGWEAGTLGPMVSADDDFFIDWLFEGTASSSVPATVYTELTAPATSFTELTSSATPWTEVSG
jgi:hypothetical protein